MSKEELRQSLDALHTELNQVTTIDAAIKGRMEHLIEDIERQLEEPDSLEHGRNAQQKLPTLIEQFEADHPKLTERLNGLMVTLSGMGV